MPRKPKTTLELAARAICFALASMVAGPSNADDGGLKEFCAKISEVAEFVMLRRQEGYPLVTQLDDLGATDPLVHELILDAYAQSRGQTEEYRLQAIEDFRDRWAYICYAVERPRPS